MPRFRMAVWTLLLLVASLSNALAQSPAFEKILANGARPVTGPELTALLADRTHYGRFLESPDTWIEYYAPDGRLAFDDGRDVSFGSWRVAKDQVCFRYLGSSDNDVPCYRYFMLGEIAYGVLTNEAGMSVVSYRVDAIVAGDPEALSSPR